jgi:hypothetical protein
MQLLSNIEVKAHNSIKYYFLIQGIPSWNIIKRDTMLLDWFTRIHPYYYLNAEID